MYNSHPNIYYEAVKQFTIHGAIFSSTNSIYIRRKISIRNNMCVLCSILYIIIQKILTSSISASDSPFSNRNRRQFASSASRSVCGNCGNKNALNKKIR